jgi:Tol biopolymer transport system component
MWLGLVVGLAAATMSGCVPAGVESGVYAFDVANGAVTWIGGPAGVPVWSPIDDSIAWGNEDGLFVRSLNESAALRLSTAPVAGVPAWSPDGNRIAYIDRDRVSLVVVTVPTGVEQFTQPLDRHRGGSARFPILTLGGPSWAPDGTRLAYVCWDGDGDEICVIESDGSRSRQVTRLAPPAREGESATPRSTLAASNTGPPAWAPRGDMLAIAIYPERSGAPTGVFLVNPERGLARRVSSLQPNSEIRWFPDGGSLLFSAFRRGRSDAFQVVIASTSQRRVTEGLTEGSRNPALSPDGFRIAVESGGGVVILSEQGPERGLAVSGLRGSHPSWSHDGTTIAISTATDPITVYN